MLKNKWLRSTNVSSAKVQMCQVLKFKYVSSSTVEMCQVLKCICVKCYSENVSTAKVQMCVKY